MRPAQGLSSRCSAARTSGLLIAQKVLQGWRGLALWLVLPTSLQQYLRVRCGRAVAALPRQLQTAAGPAGVGLRALRAATWAAALTLATLRVRGACFTAADYACLAAQRCAPARQHCIAGFSELHCWQCIGGPVSGRSITGGCLPGKVQDGVLLRRPCVLICDLLRIAIATRLLHTCALQGA